MVCGQKLYSLPLNVASIVLFVILHRNRQPSVRLSNRITTHWGLTQSVRQLLPQFLASVTLLCCQLARNPASWAQRKPYTAEEYINRVLFATRG